MNPQKIAFLYNLRHQDPDMENPASLLEIDFDSRETIDAIIKAFEKCGFYVLPIEADENAYKKLMENREDIDIAFNYAEGLNGEDRETHIPAMLEMLKIPYVGLTPLTQSIIFNKVKTKEILLQNNIPTAAFHIFKSEKDEIPSDLAYPVMVKPEAQGQSAGIFNNSVVDNEKDLKERISFIHETYNQAAFIEPFLSGREFSVSMIGNPPEILPIVELKHENLPAGYPKFASLEVKFFMESDTDYLKCPAEIDEDLKKKIEKICLNTWNTLNLRDWGRIDIRCDENGNPFVLEINSPASIEPPETVKGYCSFILAAEKAGLDFESLLKKIINSSYKRYEFKRL